MPFPRFFLLQFDFRIARSLSLSTTSDTWKTEKTRNWMRNDEKSFLIGAEMFTLRKRSTQRSAHKNQQRLKARLTRGRAKQSKKERTNIIACHQAHTNSIYEPRSWAVLISDEKRDEKKVWGRQVVWGRSLGTFRLAVRSTLEFIFVLQKSSRLLSRQSSFTPSTCCLGGWRSRSWKFSEKRLPSTEHLRIFKIIALN